MFCIDSFYSFYITTNSTKEAIYCGMTNDLCQRITEHYISRGLQTTFAGRYFCYWLLYFEHYEYVDEAIRREKEVKKWNRKKKELLISNLNPDWKFLNVELFGEWPPRQLFNRKDL